MANFTVGWVDFAAIIVILLGVIRGRRRGISEELLDVVKWLGIVAVGSYLYGPLGEILSAKLPFSRLSCYVAVYLAIVVLFKVGFAFLRRGLGEKLVGSDTFGRSEYYLGMAAGATRYACVFVVVLAVLNARYYSPEEIRAEEDYQERFYGSIRFPTLYSLQKQVFEVAFTGRVSREYAPFLLIRPTSPEEKGLDRSGIARAREREFNDVLDRR